MQKIIVSGLICLMVGVFVGMDLADGKMPEVNFERYGMPKGYDAPVNVESRNGDRLCVLWPDGLLEKEASWEFIVRTMIARHREVLELVRSANTMIATRNDKIESLGKQVNMQKEMTKDLKKEVTDLEAQLDEARRAAEQ